MDNVQNCDCSYPIERLAVHGYATLKIRDNNCKERASSKWSLRNYGGNSTLSLTACYSNGIRVYHAVHVTFRRVRSRFFFISARVQGKMWQKEEAINVNLCGRKRVMKIYMSTQVVS
jgi:hypothetical protein